MVTVEPGPWSLAPAPAMDEITFRSDTVLSDVHLYTPNQRRLMVRLNGMGQPGKEPAVFSASSQKGRGGLACLTCPRTTSSEPLSHGARPSAFLSTCFVAGLMRCWESRRNGLNSALGSPRTSRGEVALYQAGSTYQGSLVFFPHPPPLL